MPEANEDLAKAKFYAEIARAKNARASGVRWSALFYVIVQNFVIVEIQILYIRNIPRQLHNLRLLFGA